MRIPDLVSWYAPERRQTSLVTAVVATAAIATTDWMVKPNIGIGYLYLFPIVLLAGFISEPQIALFSGLCAALRELFGPLTHNIQSVPRAGFIWLTFCGVGVFMRELVLARQETSEHLARLRAEMELREREVRLREQAEKQVQALIESSPAAILTATEDGMIELSNDAARTLLRSNASLGGESLTRFIPDAAVIQSRLGDTSVLRTAVECRGLRADGEIFLGHLWLSRFTTVAGPRLAIIISDASEQLRDREEVGLQQSLSSSRLLVSAVSHEIRNLSSAVAIAHANLARVPALDHNTDFVSLGKLIEGLRNLASAELMPVTRAAQEGLQLTTLFDDLQIVLQPSAEEARVQLRWNIPPELPRVRADRQGLFQVFLNLSHNSFRAMSGANDRALTICVTSADDVVIIRFHDTGSGVSQPERLFRMFHSGTNSSGIGLYISRAILRSYGGDLRYEPTDSGACFAVELLCTKGTVH